MEILHRAQMGQDVYIYGILFIYIYINRQIFVLSTSVGLAALAPIIPSGILSASPTLARYRGGAHTRFVDVSDIHGFT